MVANKDIDTHKELLFLAWESPWPALGGGSLRTLGLLKELSKSYAVHLVVLSKKPLSDDQETELQNYVSSITRVPMVGVTPGDYLHILALMFTHRIPYHCALLHLSFRRASDVMSQVRSFSGIVYASYGHWGALVQSQKASNWVLDQHNADVQFWRVYASQASNIWLKLAALVNWRLAAEYFPRIYSNVGSVVSVCEDDRQLTLALAPKAKVDVIENGVDCTYYVPDRALRSGPPRLLFTGTSAPRNVTALRQFARNVWPLVRQELPEAELLVAGDFKPQAQAEFRQYSNIHFTGRIEDIRPFFDQSDVFIAPFEETHGSKLKIAEAMAMGIPIVSTMQGIRGFALQHGESVMLAKTNEEFAAHVVALIKDSNRCEQLGRSARELALRTIDWQILGKRLAEMMKTMELSLLRNKFT